MYGKLVVDGSNLVHSQHTMEWSNGGQYRQYRSAVRQFYLKLLNSGITPIVIFDGVTDEQKTSVVMKRKQDQVNIIHQKITDAHILPPLCCQVYLMILYDLGIDFYVADGEADIVIARVANHYSCPVLSTDSDFFMFRLIGGYIPYSNFDWKSSVIRADIYHRDEFAVQLGFKDSSLLNVIPAIVGNDFISPCSHPSMPDGENEIRSICRYLKQFSSLEEYLASTSSRSHESKCRQAKEWYEIPDSLSCKELVETTQLRPKNGSQFPQWFVELFHKGHVPPAPLAAAIHCKAIFRMIPDNFHKESSIVAGQIIRRQIYSLLGCDEVVEFFRHKLNISGVKVSSAQLTGSYNSVTLASVESMTNEERQTLFYSVCKCDERALSHLTGQYSDWKFVATTVRLWISTTEPPEKLVKALLHCFTLCSGLDDDRLNSLRRKYRMPITFHKSQRWLDALHSFMQWQVIYHTAWTLNALLKEPMGVFSPAYLYDGEMIMYLASAENIDQLISSFVSYKDRTLHTLHRYLEKSVLDIPSRETQQMVVIPTTECIFMAPAEKLSGNLDVIKQCRTKDNFKTVVDCHHSHSHAVHQQSDAADNECTPPVPPENLQTSKHDVDTRDSIQLVESETVHNDLNPRMIKPLTTSGISVDQVKSQVNTYQKAATTTKPKKCSRRKRRANKDSLSVQSNETHSPDRSRQLSSDNQSHPPINISGFESKTSHTHPHTKVGQSSKAVETHLPNYAGQQSREGQAHSSGQQSKAGQTHPLEQQLKAGQTHLPGQQSKAGQIHPPKHKSQVGQARPPGQQSKADQTHPQGQQSKASQTHPGNQQTKARQTHPSKSSQVASQNGNLQPQITAENAKAENSIISVDNLLPHYAQSSRTAQGNASPTLSAVTTRRKKRVAHSGVKTNGMQATNQTQTKTSPSKDDSPREQLETVHSEQLSQQSGDSAQISSPQKKVRKRRRPRCTTATTHDDTQTETTTVTSHSHSHKQKAKENTVPERNHHDAATDSSTTEQCFTSANPPLPQTFKKNLTKTARRQHI